MKEMEESVKMEEKRGGRECGNGREEVEEKNYSRVERAIAAMILMTLAMLLTFTFQMFTTPPPGLNYVTITRATAEAWIAGTIIAAAVAAWLATRE